MQVFIDTNVLIDVAVRIDKYPDSFALLNKLMELPDYSLWIAAVSVNNIQYIVSKLEDETKANKLLELIREEFHYSYKYGDILIPKIDGGGPLRTELAHFVDCIENDTVPLSDGYNGLGVVKVLEKSSKALKKAWI